MFRGDPECGHTSVDMHIHPGRHIIYVVGGGTPSRGFLKHVLGTFPQIVIVGNYIDMYHKQNIISELLNLSLGHRSIGY